MTTTMADTIGAQRALRRSLDGVELGSPRHFANLSVWPLLGGRAQADYSLLGQVLADGTAQVTELDDGSVPEIRFVNRGEHPVLLVDGEELIGALQNRSLNLSILAPASEALTIPVSCMEAGRWGYGGGPEFRHSGHVMNARLRMSRMRSVSKSLRESSGGRRMSNQDAIWTEINEVAQELEAPSDTGAINDAFERYGRDLEEYERALNLPLRSCGAAFAIAGGAHGLDLFDAQSTFRSLFPQLVRSWSLDAIAAARQGKSAGRRVDPRILLDRLARRRCRVYRAVGLGTDARLARRGSRLQGAALIRDEAAVHVSAFHSGFNS